MRVSSIGGVGSLEAITAVGSGAVWAVGYEGSGLDRVSPLLVRWTGGGWVRERIPQLVTVGDLTGVVALSPRDVWAVGGTGGGGTGFGRRPLVLHWDGRTWQNVRVRVTASDGRELYAVDAVSATDVWAVGAQGLDARSLYAISEFGLHWDGSSWQAGSELETGSGSLDAIDVVSRSSIFTISNPLDDASYLNEWDGSSSNWVYSGGDLADLAALSTRDVWLVGQVSRSDGTPLRPLVIHWDGKTGKRVRDPFEGLKGASLSGIDARSPTDIWAVGNHLIARCTR